MSAPKLTKAQRSALVRASSDRLTAMWLTVVGADVSPLVERGLLSLDLHITPAGRAALCEVSS